MGDGLQCQLSRSVITWIGAIIINLLCNSFQEVRMFSVCPSFCLHYAHSKGKREREKEKESEQEELWRCGAAH